MKDSNQLLAKVASRLRSDFYTYFQLFWDKISSEELKTSNHIEFLCNTLQEIGNDIVNKKDAEYDWIIINVPPGSSKTSICSQLFPAWLLTKDNSIFTIGSSYSDTLATGFVRKTKNVFEGTDYANIFGALELTKDNEGHIETKQGGGWYSTSIGGTVTGVHANLIVVDDPLSTEQSYSQAHIKKANRYISETLTSRVRDKDKAVKILIMQRLNEDDPTGMLLDSGLKIKHICLPAELSDSCTNPELYKDGLLDPIRMGRDTLNKFKLTLGSYGYACQFDQIPAPLEGGIIKRDWFIIDKLQNSFRKTVIIDGAYTNDKKNDPTGILICSYNNGKIQIHNFIQKWYTIAEMLSKFPEIATANGLTQRDEILIEPKASGKDMVSMFRAMFNIPTNEYRGNFIKVSKTERIQTSSPHIQAGKVVLNKGTWNDAFINEVCSFPNAKHDEAVDCLAYAVEKFLMNRSGFMVKK